MKLALAITSDLEARGKSVSVISCHTIKPLDVVSIQAALRQHQSVIVIEESAGNGALGMQIKSIAWDMRAETRLETFCLDDAFHHMYGPHEDLLAAYGLSMQAVLTRLGDLAC
jgi:transketolase